MRVARRVRTKVRTRREPLVPWVGWSRNPRRRVWRLLKRRIGELWSCVAPRLAEFLGRRVECFSGFGNFAIQTCSPFLAILKLCKFCGGTRTKLDHNFDRRAVFAFEILDGIEPRLGGLKSFGIRIECRCVAVNIPRQILQRLKNSSRSGTQRL